MSELSVDWLDGFKSRLLRNRTVIVYGNLFDEFPLGENEWGSLEALLKRHVADFGVTDVATYAPNGNNQFDFDEKYKSRYGGQIVVFPYMEQAFPRTGQWRDEDWARNQSLAYLIRQLADHDPTTKFLPFFATDRLIPDNFLTGIPSVTRFGVPLPGQSERNDWVNSCEALAGTSDEAKRRRSRLVSETRDLYWQDLSELRAGQPDFETLHSRVREKKFGRQVDPWAKFLDSGDLHDAFNRIAGDAAPEPVRGQDQAVDKSLKVVSKASFGITSAGSGYNRPKGVLFFAGPTGVGKTMLAKKLAAMIFGSEEDCLVFDMSEYASEASESRLVGAPPGYVGYEAGGQLTDAVRKRPFSIVLFDEIEKANPEIFTKFLQLLDEGRLTDGRGISTDFSNALIIFTSNIGAKSRMEIVKVPPENPNDPESEASSGALGELSDNQLIRYYRYAIKKHMPFNEKPEILNRIGLSNIVPFRFVSEEHVNGLIDALALRFQKQFLKTHDVNVSLDDIDFKNVVRTNANWSEYGMRDVGNTFDSIIIEPLTYLLGKGKGSNAMVGRLGADGLSIEYIPRER